MPVIHQLYTSSFYELQAVAESGIIVARWLRPVTHQEMITGGTNLYKALLETKYTKVLANGQQLHKLDANTKDWMSNNFYELLSKTYVAKIARVLPSNIFYQLALESVATRAEARGKVKFQYKNFSNEEDAVKWLNV